MHGTRWRADWLLTRGCVALVCCAVVWCSRGQTLCAGEFNNPWRDMHTTKRWLLATARLMSASCTYGLYPAQSLEETFFHAMCSAPSYGSTVFQPQSSLFKSQAASKRAILPSTTAVRADRKARCWNTLKDAIQSVRISEQPRRA